MNKVLFALLMAGTLIVPLGSSTSGNERNSVLSKKVDWDSKGYEVYLPFLSSSAPWLNQDTTTKPPKSDYSIGQNAKVGPLQLNTLNIQHVEAAVFGIGGSDQCLPIN